MAADNDLLVVGKVGKAYGIHGWVKLNSYTHPPENILDYQPWLIYEKKVWRKIEVEASKMQATGLLVKFAELSNPEAAKIFANCEIAVTRTQLPILESGEYYWRDLEGLTVVNTEGQTLGKVNHLLSTGANDVLVVKGDREHLIPFLLDHFVIKVDLTNKQITVDWDPEF